MQRFLDEARSWIARSRGGFIAAKGAAHARARVETDAARRRLLTGAGEVRARLRSAELHGRPIGPVKGWPRALLGAMRVCIESPSPAWLAWGRDDPLLLYNDAAIALLADAHPRAFGVAAEESGAEIWETSAPSIQSVFASGSPRRLPDQLLMLARNGRTEERYFDMLLTAVLDDGDVQGVLCTAVDTTARVQSARRSAVLSDLAARAAEVAGEQDAWHAAVASLERNPADLPYALLYAADGPDDVARLVGTVGLSSDSARAPLSVDPSATDAHWPLGDARRSLEPVSMRDAMICPLIGPGGGRCGYLIAGLSPRLPLDDAYRSFLTGAAAKVAGCIAAARSREEHARRAASLERGRARLEQRCAELTQLFELAPIPMLVVRGRDHVVERMNTAAHESSNGRSLVGRPLFESLPELTSQGFDRRLASVLDTRQPDIGREVVVPLERGGKLEETFFTFISAPLDAQNRDDARIIIVAIEVTEQVRARRALEASEARYRHIFDTIDASIWEEDFSRVLPSLDELAASGVDDLGRYLQRHPDFLHKALEQVSVLDVNESTLRLFGASDKRELARSVGKLFLPETWEAFTAKLLAMRDGPRLTRTDTVASTLQGERLELMMTMAPADDSARSGRALITVTDITERKRMEQALREADRQKDEFLATLAHELRNPLAPLRSGVDLLRTMPEQAPAEVLDIVERQVEHLARLAADLFESSRIRRGSYDLRKERVELSEVLRDAADASAALIRASGHELEMRMPGEPLWIDGDRTRLAQIFANLLNNAARYTTQPGRITVSAERTGDGAKVCVADTGIGIPPEAMGNLFTMYARLGRDENTRFAGLGIGLALAKQLTEMHGGTIQAQSEGAGRGSTFIVQLPLADVEHWDKRADEDDEQSIAGRRLLVVEDDRDTAESLRLILAANGADVRVAANGSKALASFASFEPHVVLLDIGLPGMSGYEVARRLRAEFPRRASIIALTGWGREEDVRRALEAGCDDHLVKPVEIGALRRVLAGAAETAREAAGESPQATPRES